MKGAEHFTVFISSQMHPKRPGQLNEIAKIFCVIEFHVCEKLKLSGWP